MVFSKAWGDVHIVTYNGLLYDFQAAGEFTLAQSRITGDTFDIQLRLTPYYNFIRFEVVSVITQTAMSLGADRITFDSGRAATVWVNGAATTLSNDSPVLNLAAGSVTQLAANIWKVVWNSGEEATVTDWGNHLDVYDGIPLSAPNFVGGLQGEDAGQANDFQLSDGAVLPQPLTYATLYGVFADSWRVTQPTSLFDYGPGETTQTFTNRSDPAGFFDTKALPGGIQAQASTLVTAAGITDPGIAAAAQRDFLITGDSSFIDGAAVIQQQVRATTVFTPTAIPIPPTEVGVRADPPGVVQSKNATTPVVFDVYLTQPAVADTVVSYAVVDGGAGFLGAATFGAALPTGTVTIAAGSQMAQFTVAVPANALGGSVSAKLEVSIAAPDSLVSVVPVAVGVVANNAAVAGVPALPRFIDRTTPKNLTATSATSYTLNLGTFKQGEVPAAEQLSLQNNAALGSDSLTGLFGAPVGAGVIITGANLTAALRGGASYDGITVSSKTGTAGAFTETLTFTPKDVNATGYTATLPVITLTIIETVLPSAQAGLNSPDMILFPNVRVGTAESRAVSVSNTAASPAGSLNVTPTPVGPATSTGAVTALAPGKTDATSITVGLNTTTGGSKSGAVSLGGSSISPDGTLVALVQAPQVAVLGGVFRPAVAAIATAAVPILHVGDAGTVALKITNTAVADGFSENLVATLAGVTTGLTAASTSPTAPIAAGASDGTINVKVSTASAGVITGTATFNLVSDGGAGAASIDGLGQMALAQAASPISITVNNFAQATLVSSGPALVAGSAPGTYTLNLGTFQAGQAAAAVTLSAQNSAAGPADLLNGAYTVNNASGFTNTGFASFTNLAAGSAAAAGSIAIDTTQTGAHTETIVLAPTDTNASGFSLAQAAQTVTVNYAVTGVAPTRVLAAASITPVIPASIVHVGDTTTVALNVSNIAPTGGNAESLIAALGAASGGLTAVGASPTPDILAGASNATLQLTVDTSKAATIAGAATVNLTSDGGVGAGSIDGLGTAPLTPITVPVNLTVDNYAQAAFSTAGPAVVPTGTSGAVTINLGTYSLGQTVSAFAIGAQNTASGPADLLRGGFTVIGNSAFTNTGFDGIGSVAAGSTAAAGTIGINTGAAGTFTETVTLHPTDSNSTGFSLVQADQVATVSFTVSTIPPTFRQATGSVTAAAIPILHVGDAGKVTLKVANTAVADGLSESLIAAVASTSGGLLASSSGPTADIASGASDSTLAVAVNTSTAGTISGSATVSLTSDGGTGAGSIDGKGQTPLTPATVPLTATIDNYAVSSLTETVNGVAAKPVGATLNLGTFQQGAAPLTIALTEANTATGPADLLAAAFLTSSSPAFTNALAPVSGLAAGTGASAGTITFATNTAGTFSETITVNPTGSNASGYVGALAAQTLTITGIVAGPVTPPGSPPPTPTIALLPPQGGPAAQKAIINSPNPILSGATAASAAVTLKSAGAAVGATTAIASGYYQTTTSANLPQGTSTVTATASNASGTSGTSAPVSAFEIPVQVNGVSSPDLASIDFGRLFDAGYVLQFTQGTQAAGLVDGRLSVGPDTNEAYIQRLYEGLLGRGNEPTGIIYWNHLLDTGHTKQEVANGFLTSAEFVTGHGAAANVAPAPFINFLYASLLGRGPTAGDLAFWTGQLAQAGQAAVLQGIADSPEAKAYLAPTTARVWARNDAGTLTHELFETGLGREVELTPGAGLSFWTSIMANYTPQQAAALFVQSVEFQAGHASQDNAAYVKSLFGAGLGRDPQATETQPLVAALQSGAASRADVLLQVATSAGAVVNLTRNL